MRQGRAQPADFPPLEGIFDFAATATGALWFVGQRSADGPGSVVIAGSTVLGAELDEDAPSPANGKWTSTRLPVRIGAGDATPSIVAALDGSAWALAAGRVWVASGSTVAELELPAVSGLKVLHLAGAKSATEGWLVAEMDGEAGMLRVHDGNVSRVPVDSGVASSWWRPMGGEWNVLYRGDEVWAYSSRGIWKQVRPGEPAPEQVGLHLDAVENKTTFTVMPATSAMPR